jgi:23S rRNA pseudouridine2605 synthase
MSRRAAELLIEEGRVTIDGHTAAVGERVDPERQKVAIDGRPIPVRPGLVTYLLYKPVGVISTADDPQGRPTVVDLVPSSPRVYPVGRLDADSEGLLLLTNDGDLAQLVTHPSHGIDKTYTVLVDGPPDHLAQRLTEGVELEDGPAVARSARVVDTMGTRTLLEVVMGEGRNREVRRMMEALGRPVTSLVRTQIGPIRDRHLTPGGWRLLDVTEVERLYAAAVGA